MAVPHDLLRIQVAELVRYHGYIGVTGFVFRRREVSFKIIGITIDGTLINSPTIASVSGEQRMPNRWLRSEFRAEAVYDGPATKNQQIVGLHVSLDDEAVNAQLIPEDVDFVDFGVRSGIAQQQFLNLLHANSDWAVLQIVPESAENERQQAFSEHLGSLTTFRASWSAATEAGDLHRLSSSCGPSSFDLVYAVSVIQHCAMPWKFALELNKVLKDGGYAYIHSHQTLGMHELPWDFWRFSDSAWHSLFNRHTGFEIEASSLSEPMYALPRRYSAGYGDERSTGFAGSTVLAKKIGSTSLEWAVPALELGIR